MLDTGSILTFIIVSFAFALILIMKRNSLPPQVKRYLALFALLMVVMSFVLMLYSILHHQSSLEPVDAQPRLTA